MTHPEDSLSWAALIQTRRMEEPVKRRERAAEGTRVPQHQRRRRRRWKKVDG